MKASEEARNARRERGRRRGQEMREGERKGKKGEDRLAKNEKVRRRITIPIDVG